jgi:diguanylate cyclase (GGDEF)-like protein/PAS domain S-box-containing protein
MGRKSQRHNPSMSPMANETLSAAQAIRQRAEEALRQQTDHALEEDASLSREAIREVLLELHVHQIELEMQNEELRRTQLELEAARTRYFDIYDLAPVAYCSVSQAGLILEANLTAATLLGVARGALVKLRFSRFIRKADQDVFYLHHKQALSTGQAPGCDLRMLKFDGQPFWAHLETATAQDADGATVLRIVISDITERKRADADLRIAAVAFESQHSMMVTNAHHLILRVNRAFTEVTGYAAEEVIGKTPGMLSSGLHDAHFFRTMWKTIHSTGIWQGEIFDRRKSGEVYPTWLTISPVRDGAGTVTHYVATHFDITERKKADRKIAEMAFFDIVTGVPNRALLLDHMKQAMTVSERNKTFGAVLFIDLEHFKTLNDTLGHDPGDLLLKAVAQRLVAGIREGDTVARLGGDEFVILLENLSANIDEAATQTEVVGEKVLAALARPYLLGAVDHRGTASVGATLFRGHETSIDNILKQADMAMYKAKEAGRTRLHFFDPAMQILVLRRAELEASLRGALRESQLELHYQPQFAGDGKLIGSEALLRWRHPVHGTVAPAEFIPLAEQTGLILALGDWVLENVCSQLAKWAERPPLDRLAVAVNVSARQFREADFADKLLAILGATGANPKRLTLELTESLLVHDVDDLIEKVSRLKARGVGFALDDFGTGYSSLSYLKRLPLDQVKIDQSFVRDVLDDSTDAAIARGIVALAHSLELEVIAEGVDSEAQRDFLASAGCDAYQGYFFSQALPVDDFEAFALRG